MALCSLFFPYSQGRNEVYGIRHQKPKKGPGLVITALGSGITTSGIGIFVFRRRYFSGERNDSRKYICVRRLFQPETHKG